MNDITLTIEELQQAHSELKNHSKKCEKQCLMEIANSFNNADKPNS